MGWCLLKAVGSGGFGKKEEGIWTALGWPADLYRRSMVAGAG